MKNLDNYTRWGIVLFIGFLIFTFIVWTGRLENLDWFIIVNLQRHIPEVFIAPFSLFSIIGSFEVTTVLLILLLFLFSVTKKLRILFLFGLIALIEIIGKTYIPQLAPPEAFHRTIFHLGFPSGGVAHELFAYPSGHSGRTAFLVGLIFMMVLTSDKLNKLQKRLIYLGLFIFSVIMFMSRVYLGEHWLTDVVGGALLGFSLAFLINFILNLNKNFKH